MNGYYVFKENGVEIAKSTNVITYAGKQLIAQNLSSQYNVWAGQIAIGADNTTALPTDKALGFEFSRGPVVSISNSPIITGSTGYTGGTIRLVAKAVLEANVSGIIYETGLFSQTQSPDKFNSPIFYTTSSESWSYQSNTGPTGWVDVYNAGGFITGGRSGDGLVDFSIVPTLSNAKTVRYQGFVDMSDVKPSDNISISYFVSSSTGSTGPIDVRFHNDSTNYFSYKMPVPSSETGNSGYKIVSAVKNNWVSTGSPIWNNINYIEIQYNTTGNNVVVTYLDGLRVTRSDTNSGTVLVSRSIPSSPVVKTEGTPLEIEYYLDVF